MNQIFGSISTLKKLLCSNPGAPVEYSKIAQSLSDLLGKNIYIIGRRGSILAIAGTDGKLCSINEEIIALSKRSPERYLEELNHIGRTIKLSGCIFQPALRCECSPRFTLVVPAYSGQERLATLVVVGQDEVFTETELVLAEYASLILALEIRRMINERTERNIYQDMAIQTTLNSLSFVELEAASALISSLNNNSRDVIVSKVADEIGMTRIALVQMLGKLSCAGVITLKSQGRRGSIISLILPKFREALHNHILKT